MVSIKLFLVFSLIGFNLVGVLLFTDHILSKIGMNPDYRPWITALHIRANSLIVKFLDNKITTTEAPTEPAATTNSKFPITIPIAPKI